MTFQIQLMLVEKFATRLLQRALPHYLPYHNYHHTREVVEAAGEIGRHCRLTSGEIQLVQMAAWLHDLGHLHTYHGHEQESQAIALNLLRMAGLPQTEIDVILNCIDATRMPQSPQNLIEAVLCDADLAHLARPDYPGKSERLREEWRLVFGKVYSDEAWARENERFLRRHRYWTDYGKTVLAAGKAENLPQPGARKELFAL